MDAFKSPRSAELNGSWVWVLGDRLSVRTHCLKLSEKVTTDLERRKARDLLIKNLAKSLNAHKIATAHTSDDNAEIFLNAAISGGEFNNTTVLNPRGSLGKPLWSSRDELMAYARRSRLTWIEPVDAKPKLQVSGRVRSEILPNIGTTSSWRTQKHFSSI